MKAGAVTTMRINPRDCQSCLDVMKAVSINTNDMSFSQIASLTLSSLLESARKTGLLPEPNPFEFLNRMEPYIGTKNTRRKTKITTTINNLGSAMRAPALEAAELDEELSEPVHQPAVAQTPEDMETVRAATVRLTELSRKRDMADDGVEGVTWSTADDVEYRQCVAIVYPDG